MKGVIYRLLRRYQEHNTYYSDYLKFTALLYTSLLVRGHLPEDIRPIFLAAHARIKSNYNKPTIPPTDQPTNQPPTQTIADASALRMMCLHLTYHPCDTPRRTVRQLYEKNCHEFKSLLGTDKPIIAYSRPKNIGDTATKAKLQGLNL